MKIKKVIIIFIILILVISLTSTVYALKPNEVKIEGELNDGGAMQSFGNKIFGIIQVVGVVVSVIILVVIGIKYMVGSVEEKADYKKALMPYLIGAVILFSSTTIANMVYQIANPAPPKNTDKAPAGGNPADPWVEKDFGE